MVKKDFARRHPNETWATSLIKCSWFPNHNASKEPGTTLRISGGDSAAINHGNLFAGQAPFLNEGMIGSTGFQLIKSGLHGIEHGGITLTYDYTLQACIDYRATDGKLARMKFDIVVGDRGVLVGCDDAVGGQQLYDIGLICQGGNMNG